MTYCIREVSFQHSVCRLVIYQLSSYKECLLGFHIRNCISTWRLHTVPSEPEIDCPLQRNIQFGTCLVVDLIFLPNSCTWFGVVYCGLTSHSYSAIFQLHSDSLTGHYYDLLLGTHSMGIYVL